MTPAQHHRSATEASPPTQPQIRQIRNTNPSTNSQGNLQPPTQPRILHSHLLVISSNHPTKFTLQLTHNHNVLLLRHNRHKRQPTLRARIRHLKTRRRRHRTLPHRIATPEPIHRAQQPRHRRRDSMVLDNPDLRRRAHVPQAH